MNYSKSSVKKKRKKARSKGAMVAHRFLLIFVRALLVCLLALVIIGACVGFGAYKGILASAPSIDSIDVSPTGYLSTVYDQEGEEIATLVSAGANRQYVTIDQIPEDLQHAFVAIEDERFYVHNGIDLKGIVRAGFKGIARVLKGDHMNQGASTITQQLLKNNVFTSWVTETSFTEKLKRKLQEQYLAVQLEKKVSKEWILENYLNSINLSQNTLGVQAAALRYFNKDVSELNLAESAVIAAITKNPSAYNPISHPEANEERKNETLKKMLEQGYITDSEYKEAMEDDVYSRIQEVNTVLKDSSSNSYFVDALVEQVAEDLVTYKGYSETQAYKLIYSGGLQIYSTQDSEIQSICETALCDKDNYTTSEVYINYYIKYTDDEGSAKAISEYDILNWYKENKNKNYTLDYKNEDSAREAIDNFKAKYIEQNGGSFDDDTESVLYVPEPQASITIIDQYTGEVKGLVGGRGEKTGSMTLNRASGTTRQPGSTFKILSAYAPALDSAGHTLASVQDDAPFNKVDGNPLKNYDGVFRGFTSYREGITNSINVVAVKTLESITPAVGYDYLLNFGFTSLSNADIVQVLCLGGISKGVSNLELTAAYATIANSGVYTAPRFYTKILDHDGNVLIDKTPQTHTVLKETTCWLLTSAMEDVMTKGTGVKANFSGMSIAGKSGTTTGGRDAWFAGFTPYYTCVVWGGYDDNSKMESTSYVKGLWKVCMSKIHKDLANKDFVKPDGIVTAKVCAESGLLAIDGVCDHDPRGSQVVTEYFAKGTVPTEYCNHHIQVDVCSTSGEAACEYCPSVTTKVFLIGGEPGSAISKYLLPENFESKICSVHEGGYDEDPDEDEGQDVDDTIDDNDEY